jgi:hypothetical protein
MRRIPFLLRLFVLVAVLTSLTLGCDGCKDKTPPSQTVNAQAQDTNRKALEPRLDKLKLDHPELAGTIDQIKSTWSTDERVTYNAVRPLMQTYKAEHPSESTQVDNVLWAWDHRLTEFGK